MAEVIYKSGQGYWTRLMSAVAIGLLALLGGAWIWERWGGGASSATTRGVVMGVAALFVAVVGIAAWWYFGRNPRSVDFLIATEGEMKKVNWSTRREIIGSTQVVVLTMLIISGFCFVCDLAFATLMRLIGVLDSQAASQITQ